MGKYIDSILENKIKRQQKFSKHLASNSTMDESTPKLELPGFRFHPTEEELLNFYLKNMVLAKRLRFDVIGFLNIYRHEPCELPGLAKIGEREWYFLVPRDRRHSNGGRPNRTTEKGFWKATGSDRKIVSLSEPKRIIGMRKTLVFYNGRAPRGSKTDWVMNEYRLPDHFPLPKEIVLCKIYRKATSLKVLEQMAAREAQKKQCYVISSLPPLSIENSSFCSQQGNFWTEEKCFQNLILKREEVEALGASEEKEEEEEEEKFRNASCSSMQFPYGKGKLPELQVPKFMSDWTQDSFWTINSPWLQNVTAFADATNF